MTVNCQLISQITTIPILAITDLPLPPLPSCDNLLDGKVRSKEAWFQHCQKF